MTQQDDSEQVGWLRGGIVEKNHVDWCGTHGARFTRRAAEASVRSDSALNAYRLQLLRELECVERLILDGEDSNESANLALSPQNGIGVDSRSAVPSGLPSELTASAVLAE